MAGLATTASRTKSFGLAASLALASFSLMPSTARAMEPIAPACLKAGGEAAQLRCSIALSKKATAAYEAKAKSYEARTKAAGERITAADKINDAALSSKACFDTVTQDITAAKKAGPLTPAQKTAFRTRIAECDKT